MNKTCTSTAIYQPGAKLVVANLNNITLYAGWRKIDVSQDGSITIKEPSNTKVTKLTLSKTKLQLKVGSKYNLKVSSNGKVSYRSSNKKIAAVTSKGKITAKKAGNVNIIVSLNGVNKICKVIIKTPTPKKIKLQHTKKSLKKGNTYRIKYSLIGGTATVSFKSSNKKVATVTSKGLIKTKKKGQTIITVRTSNNKKAAIKITVK